MTDFTNLSIQDVCRQETKTHWSVEYLSLPFCSLPQLVTYKSRNRVKGQKYRDQRHVHPVAILIFFFYALFLRIIFTLPSPVS